MKLLVRANAFLQPLASLLASSFIAMFPEDVSDGATDIRYQRHSKINGMLFAFLDRATRDVAAMEELQMDYIEADVLRP